VSKDLITHPSTCLTGSRTKHYLRCWVLRQLLSRFHNQKTHLQQQSSDTTTPATCRRHMSPVTEEDMASPPKSQNAFMNTHKPDIRTTIQTHTQPVSTTSTSVSTSSPRRDGQSTVVIMSNMVQKRKVASTNDNTPRRPAKVTRTRAVSVEWRNSPSRATTSTGISPRFTLSSVLSCYKLYTEPVRSQISSSLDFGARARALPPIML